MSAEKEEKKSAIKKLAEAMGRVQLERAEKQRNCKHHPFDRDVDDFGNEFCTICGKVTMHAYADDDDLEELEFSDIE